MDLNNQCIVVYINLVSRKQIQHSVNENSPNCNITLKVLNIGYRNRIGWGFSYQILDIGGDIGDTRAYRAFILDTIYNEILTIKSWFRVIHIIYLIKMM